MRFRSLDLTASEINALANLADGKGRTVSQLGAAVGTRPTTLSRALAGLPAGAIAGFHAVLDALIEDGA